MAKKKSVKPPEAEMEESGTTSTASTNMTTDNQAPVSQEQEYLNGWKRALADYENLKRETEQHRLTATQFATRQLIEDLLPTLDYLEAAMMHAPNADACDATVKNWVMGVQHVRKQLMDTLASHGLNRLEDATVFDPAQHEAAEEREDTSPPGTVLQTIQPGYRLHDKLLRPARVVISSGTRDTQNTQ